MRFYRLFSIKFFHEYFSSHYFNGLKLAPTGACRSIMKSFGVLQKEIGNEYLFLYKDEAPSKSLLTQLKQPITLSFYVFCEDSFLLNYSDVSFDNMNQGFLLTNRYAENSSKNSLHKNEYISDEEKVVLVNNYNVLSGYCKSEDDAVVITKTDPIKGGKVELFKGKFKELKVQYAFSLLLENGSFEFLSATSEKAINCYAVEPTSQKLFGIIEMLVDPDLLKTEGIEYRVAIGSKDVVWRYHVVNREQVSYKEFKIYSGKTIVPIKEESSVVLGNGENAYLLETADPITMAERYDNFYELEFVKEDLKTGQVLSKKRLGLPVPEISKIKISKMDDCYRAFSDMYVYL